MTSQHDTLERELRAARSAFDQVAIAPDAWQENRRRLAGAGRSRSRRRLAAVAAAAVLVSGGIAVGYDGGDRSADGGPPASGAERDPFVTKDLLGPKTRFPADHPDAAAFRQIALVDPDGSGPQVCAEYRLSGGTINRCLPRAADADQPTVSFDWLDGVVLDNSVRAVVAGVDSGVSFVEVWLSNGYRQSVELYPGGWEDSRLLAFSRNPDEGLPQRLVAYGRDRNVLQAVDLRTRFGGDEWLPPSYACAGDRVGEVVPNGEVFPNAYVALGTQDARISVRTSETSGGDGCIETLDGTRAIAGATTVEGVLVIVTTPEVSVVRAATTDGGTIEGAPTPAAGAPWSVVVVAAPMADQVRTVQGYDRYGPLGEPVRP